MRRPNPDDVRAALWTVRCQRRYRRLSRRTKVEEIEFPSSARIGVRGAGAVARLLRAHGAGGDHCLADALIAQAWRADHGDHVDVLIGVTSPSSGFSAHAWLADAPEAHAAGHEVISRIPSRPR